MMKKKKKNKNNKKNKKKRAPDPPGYLRPNSFVPRAPKGTHAGEGSLASEKVSLPTYCTRRTGKLYRARSRLYRNRFLQLNTHFAALFEIRFCKICALLHRSKLKSQNLQTSRQNYDTFWSTSARLDHMLRNVGHSLVDFMLNFAIQ